jgi:hypothetical protein
MGKLICDTCGLSALVLARQVHDELKERARKIRKLETKLLGVRRIADAKSILMRTHGIHIALVDNPQSGEADPRSAD